MRNVSQNGCCDYKRKISIQSWKICCQRAKDWKNFSCSFLSVEKIYIVVSDFSSPLKIFREKNISDKIKKEVCLSSRASLRRSRCFIYIYRAIEIPLTTYAQYSQIYLIISRLLIFHKSVFIFLLRNDTPCLVFETNITFFPSVLVSFFFFFFKKIILFFLRIKKLSFPINFTICNFYNPYKIAREIFFVSMLSIYQDSLLPTSKESSHRMEYRNES